MALARPDRPHPDPALMGWGDAAQVPVLSDQILALLRDGLGVRGPTPPIEPDCIELPAARVDPAELRSLLGAEHVRDDREVRLAHTRGRSTVDLLRLRAGEAR